LRDGQVNSIVKEMMDADSKTIKNGQKKDRKIDQLTFYYSEEKDTSLTDVKEVLVHRKDYQAKNRKINPAETRQIAWSYLGSDGNRFTLDKVFQDAEVAKGRAHFQALTPIYPNQKIVLETTKEKLSTRFVDLVAPIGFGQRGLIVAPPKVGKTTLLKDIANSIRKNYPDKKLIILLIDERPEEVTDMERSVRGADVVSSTFDETSENHIKMAELVIEHAKRRVELGQDVIILMDSITRLARAYNIVEPSSGKVLSGGVDPSSLHKPKAFFGAARNVEGGGSLTIIATALINTGSRMDDLIFEEFKGTGNMEIVLSPELASRRVYPAIDFLKSSTRKEDLLLTEDEVKILWQTRRKLEDVSEPTIGVLNHLRKHESNEDYIAEMKKFIRD